MEFSPVVIDASHWQKIEPDGFAQMRAFGVRGVILKATQGNSYIDKTYKVRCKAAANADLLVGAYHFGTDGDGETQAKHFLDVVQPTEGMLVTLDFEPNSGHEMSINEAQVFLETIEQSIGRKAVLYAGFSMLDGRMGAAIDYFGTHRLWLAAYNNHPKTPAPWTVPWLWQFSGDGVNAHGIHVPGVSAGVDMNTYGGTMEQLAAEWAGGPDSPIAQTRARSTLTERDRVRRLQSALIAEGFSPGPVDGLLGPRTIREVQRQAGFTGKDVDGIVGPMTRPVLDAALNSLGD